MRPTDPQRETRPWLLVVTDDRAVREEIAAPLGDAYRATFATSKAEAFTRLESDAIDLVLLDLQLPGGADGVVGGMRSTHGLEVLRAIRERALVQPSSGRPLPVVAITGWVDGLRDAVAVLVDEGANDLLPKPFDRAELLIRLRRALLGQAAVLPVAGRPVEEVRVALDLAGEQVQVEGLVFSGATFEVLAALHADDPALRRGPDGFVPSAALRRRFEITELSLHKRILRVRRTLREALERQLHRALADHEVIESAPWKGYRLNPRHVRVIERVQVIQEAVHGSAKRLPGESPR